MRYLYLKFKHIPPWANVIDTPKEYDFALATKCIVISSIFKWICLLCLLVNFRSYIVAVKKGNIQKRTVAASPIALFKSQCITLATIENVMKYSHSVVIRMWIYLTEVS